MICIYGLKCPIGNTIRYVGKSADPAKRLAGHIATAKCGQYNHHTTRWIRKLLRQSLVPELVILHVVTDGERWQEVERRFIASAGAMGWNLTNTTAGGEGLDYLDPALDLARRKKLSAAHKKIWGTDERRAEARDRSLKAWADPEIRHRRLAAVRLAHTRPKIRARNLEVLAAIRADPVSVKKKSESIRSNWADPVGGAKRKAALSSDECRAKMSESAKNKWADPERSKALRELRATPQYRAMMSEKAKLRSTPEYRAMMAAKTKAAWATGKRTRANPIEE